MEVARPKKIHLVNWRHHKMEQAVKIKDKIAKDFFDEMIFETVIDFCRENYGFPGALPLQSILEVEPVIPPSAFSIDQVQFANGDSSRIQKCPACGESVDAPRFTNHLSTCIKQCNVLEVAKRTIEEHN